MKFHKSLSKFLFQVFSISFVLNISESYSSPHCSREGSRLVRKVLDKNFFPIFENYGVNVSEECPLRRSRDLYHIQEKHKLFEHNARWSCQSCGKAFYRQEFLDLHMENKHRDLLVKEELSPVCLADYCQLFRCDAVNRERRNKHFWSKALCNVENMAKLRKKCLSLVKSCIAIDETPESYKQVYIFPPYESIAKKQYFQNVFMFANGWAKNTVKDDIIEETCSLITCKDYWKPLDYEMSSYEVLYYLTFTPIFIFALGIYYYNVWEYYFGDESEYRDADNSQRKQSSDNDLPGLRKRYVPNSRFTY